MNLKVLILLLLITSILPVFGNEPNNAIRWLEVKEKIEHRSSDSKKVNEKPILRPIEKSKLKPNDLNSVGIISTGITGIDPNVWNGLDEQTLSRKLELLPNLNFHSAQRFLKRILISETQPPTSSSKSLMSGKLYFLAKIDKLIEFGALDEAETIILQAPKMNRELFIRWQKISFVTGRLTSLCEVLKNNFDLSHDLSVRIICLKYLNDWQAAALTLSTASSLNLLDKSRENLLIYHLDQNVMPFENLTLNFSQFDEIDYFIIKSTYQMIDQISEDVKYLSMYVKDSSNVERKVQAIEKLAMKKSINISSLFDVYRNSDIYGSLGIWQRMISIRNLDMALKRNNEKSMLIALDRAINHMFRGDLLLLFATEYGDRLSNFLLRQKITKFNDDYAIIFALKGEIPSNWKNYKPNDNLIEMAFKIASNDSINVLDLQKAVRLVSSNLSVSDLSTKHTDGKDLTIQEFKTSKGSLILEALKISAQGINTPPEALYSSLFLLLQAEEAILAKSILIEYLIQSYMMKSQT